MFQNRVLRRISGPKKDEVTGDRRKLYNEELNDLYSSPNIVRLIKSRRMRQEGHVARMEREEVHAEFWWEGLRDRDRLEDPGVGGRIILGWIFRM